MKSPLDSRLDILPNLYERDYRNSSLPLPIDILLTTRYLKTKELVFGALYIITEKRLRKAKIFINQERIKLNKDNFYFALNKLINLGLMEEQGNELWITKRGELLTNYVTRRHYRTLCGERINDQHQDDTFLKLVNINIEHKKIILDLLRWDEPVQEK